MKCPACAENTNDVWKPLNPTDEHGQAQPLGISTKLASGGGHAVSRVSLDWMYCASPDCGVLVVRLHDEQLTAGYDGSPDQVRNEVWQAWPRHADRKVALEVPRELRDDYLEASRLLNDSPRMSAVLSRSLLADVLERYAGLKQFRLTDRIDAFVAEASAPIELQRNAQYLRVMGDFGAHTIREQTESGPDAHAGETADADATNDQLPRVEVTREEAEWTLEVIDELFSHFIVGPERSRAMREKMDEKIASAGRDPIEPPT